jgi:hypothetical protein
LQGCRLKGKPGSHATCSWECKRVWRNKPSHSQGDSHIGSWSLGGLLCHNPTFGRVWGWHSHSRNGDLGVLRDSQNYKARLQGSKHLALKLSSYHWKAWAIWTICTTSYGKKKGRESNWQFDFRPPKVRNQPNPSVCKWSATQRWKAFKESYKFALDFILIGGLSKKLWTHKVSGVQTGTISGLLLGSPGTKSHSDLGAVK